MMEEEVVVKRKWMSRSHFLDLIGVTNLIPGPNSTEMTMHCGYQRAGWKGLVVAGVSFIFPAIFITAIIAWLYLQYGQLPQVRPFVYGIKPAVVVIVLLAAWKLGAKAIKSRILFVFGVIALSFSLLGGNEIVALFGVGLLGLIWFLIARTKNTFGSLIPFSVVLNLATQLTPLKIFGIFSKIGVLLYGSGYVLFAFLEAELVTKGYLTSQVLIDAIAVGQFTPGPVLSTATFIGWQLHGFPGALAATVGIFIPSFLLVFITYPFVSKIRSSKVISAFLDAVNVAAIALIASVGLSMFKDSVTDWRTFTILVGSFLMVKFVQKLNSMYLIIGGSFLGYVLSYF